MTGVVRWVFADPAGILATETVLQNPNAMTSPFRVKRASSAGASLTGTKRALLPPLTPQAWSFSGSIRTQEHYQQLERWCAADRLIRITDHLGRTWPVQITKFDPTPKRSVGVPWRHDYTVNALVYGGPL